MLHDVDRIHGSCVLLPYAWWCGVHPVTRLLPLRSTMRLLRVPMLVCHRTIHQHDTMLLIETMSMTVIYHAAASTLPITPAWAHGRRGPWQGRARQYNQSLEISSVPAADFGQLNRESHFFTNGRHDECIWVP